MSETLRGAGRLRTLGVIPARGGSKGIPRKNLQMLAGRPLLEYTVRAATESGVIDRLIVSTESDEIAAVAQRLGVEVPFRRPDELAQDDAPMLPVIVHAVREMEERGFRPDVVALLQPTAPLRRPDHIAEALRLLEQTDCDSVVSVVEIPRHFAPHVVMRIDDGRLDHFLDEGRAITRRQDAPAAYAREGTIYAVRRDVLMEQGTIYGSNCTPLILDPTESINLDSPDDWDAAEAALASIRTTTSSGM